MFKSLLNSDAVLAFGSDWPVRKAFRILRGPDYHCRSTLWFYNNAYIMYCILSTGITYSGC